MDDSLVKLGYREWEVSAPQTTRPWQLPGTNRLLYQEYRVGRVNVLGPLPTMLLLVRRYSLGIPQGNPTIWGVSYYKPKLTRNLWQSVNRHLGMVESYHQMENLQYTHDKWGVHTSLNKNNLTGYQEYKHHFWTSTEAIDFYEHLKDQWRTP